MVEFDMFSSKVKTLWKDFLSEVKSNSSTYYLLSVILILAFFVRVYRADQLMGFYFDQGRDALVIWKFLYEGRPFLIGPVTGLAGIFLGPLYYYLISPFYYLGGGDPVFPAYFLAFLGTIAIGVVYYLGLRMNGRVAGLIAAVLASFSYYLVLTGRWLSNPSPILLTSVLLLWAMWEIVRNQSKSRFKNKLLWPVIGLLVGVSLQFESASAVFYIPMVCVFALWQRKKFPSRSIFLISCLFFLATLIPQILFNFRHENILFNNFKKVLIEERSFSAPQADNLIKKRDFFWGVFDSKIFPGIVKYPKVFYAASFFGLLLFLRKRSKELKLFAIFLGVPMIGYLFFQGNYGNIYDYYMTGYYLPMILLFSIGLAELWKNFIGKIVVVWFLFSFLSLSLPLLKNYISAGVDGSTHISLGNQKQAVNWVFDDAMSRGEFNVDVYVPPVIPYSYDYLFLWQGTRRCGEDLCGMVKDKQLPLIYILYEVDPPHPERLEAWLSRYDGNTLVEAQTSFGGIYVERRKRI